MQISRYAVIVDDYPEAGEHLLYCTRTQALVKVNEELKDVLLNLRHLHRGDILPHEQNILALYQMGIVVKDDADDAERFASFMEQRKYGIDRANFTASILTTYNCNFACTYCFEESTRTSSQKLDRPTSDLIMAWIKRRVERYQVRQLTVNYYGGEPLLNQPMMEYISSCMKSWCEERGIHFKVCIQTNGALMTPEFLDKHIPLGLEAVRVSVDGTKEVHDRQRPMRGTGKGTFDIVMKNLIHAVDRIKVSIGAGYNEGNPEGILKLLDYLDEVGVLKKLEYFLHSPIHPTLGPKHDPGAVVSPQCMGNYETDTLIRSTAIIKEALTKKGLGVKSGLSVSMCPVARENGGVTIDQNGHIFKCTSMLGHPELAVGHVREDEYNERQKQFLESDQWKKCEPNCPYAPICNMGCRLFAFFKTKDFTAKSCEKSYMDRFVPMAVKKEYDYRLQMKKGSPAEAAAV